jgi:hypothetical protein
VLVSVTAVQAPFLYAGPPLFSQLATLQLLRIADSKSFRAPGVLSILLILTCLLPLFVFSAMSCCVIPFLLGCIAPCWWANDRQALAQVFNIDDQTSWMTVRAAACFVVVLCCMSCPEVDLTLLTSVILQACCLFYCGCHGCLLCQELNHIKANPAGASPQQTVMIMPSQQVG